MSNIPDADPIILGAIPLAPVILCKTEEAATMIQVALHTHLTHEPPVIVPEVWPEGARSNAYVITPLEILGEQPPDMNFRIDKVATLKKSTQEVLNVMIRLASSSQRLTIRNITVAMHGLGDVSSKRKVDYAIRELEAAGLVQRGEERQPYKLTFGRWRMDAGTAKAAGLEITELK